MFVVRYKFVDFIFKLARKQFNICHTDIINRSFYRYNICSLVRLIFICSELVGYGDDFTDFLKCQIVNGQLHKAKNNTAYAIYSIVIKC